MGRRITWTWEMDTALLTMRARGASWEDTAARIGVTIRACMSHAKALGLPTGRMNHGRVSGRAMRGDANARHTGTPA